MGGIGTLRSPRHGGTAAPVRLAAALGSHGSQALALPGLAEHHCPVVTDYSVNQQASVKH